MVFFRKKGISAAVVQMRIIPLERERNLETAARGISEAAGRGAGLVVLPQAFGTGLNLPDLHQSAEPVPAGPTSAFLAAQATRHGVHLVAGILEKQGPNIYDTAVVISPGGRLLGKYRRWFLWGMEKDFLTPGAPGEVIETDIANLGLLLGYDLYFPEACRNYFQNRADLMICLANIYRELGAAVAPLCRARAIENHCYFLLAGGLGYHEIANSHYRGGSLAACDPLFRKFVLKEPEEDDYDLLCQAAGEETILYQRLHLEELRAHRRQAPQFEDYEFALGRGARKQGYARLVD